jgi:hypothetical protein
VQHCGENHADWLTEVDHACQLRIRQYLGRPGDVRGDGGYAIPGEQRTDMALHHRVIVHVSHSRIRADPLRCLMDGRARRHASAEVDELPDAPMGSRPCDGFDDERPVVSHQAGQARVEGNDPLGQFPVGGVVVLAAEQGIIHTRDIRLAGIEFHGHGRSFVRLRRCRVRPGERVGPCSRSARAAARPPALVSRVAAHRYCAPPRTAARLLRPLGVSATRPPHPATQCYRPTAMAARRQEHTTESHRDDHYHPVHPHREHSSPAHGKPRDEHAPPHGLAESLSWHGGFGKRSGDRIPEQIHQDRYQTGGQQPTPTSDVRLPIPARSDVNIQSESAVSSAAVSDYVGGSVCQTGV